MGQTSSFTYDSGTFITAMTTPDGTSHYAYGESGTERWLTLTDPLGHTQRVEQASRKGFFSNLLEPIRASYSLQGPQRGHDIGND